MRKRNRAYISAVVTVSSILLLLAAALSTHSVLAQSSPQTGAKHPSVTGSAQPATAQVVVQQVINERAAPASASAHLSQAANQANHELPFLTRMNPQRYAQVKAAAARSAPRSDFHGATPEIDVKSNFTGIQNSNSVCPPIGCNPPDMGLAASSSFVLEGANTSFAIFDTHGNLQPGFPKTFQDFFGIPDPGACAGDIPFTSDPREFYDPNDGRFWAAALELEGSIANSCPLKSLYWIGVSQTSDPRGAWNVYAFDMALGTTNIADFTMVGFDSRSLFFSANMFNEAGTASAYAEIFGADKGRMERDLSVSAPGFFGLTVTGPAGSFLVDTVQPAETDVPGHGPGAELFVNTFNGFDVVTGHGCTSDADSCRGLGVWAFKSADTGAPKLSFAFAANTKAYAFPPAADQPTCMQCIDSGDLRISATPIFRDDLLFAAWGTGVNNGTQVVPGVVWSEVLPGLDDSRLVSVSQIEGDYFHFGGDDAALYPALMPNGQGTLYMVFDHMSSTVNPEVRLTARFLGGAFASPGVLLKAGDAPYRPTVCGKILPVCRWGDYSATSLTGFEDGHIWFGGEYANASGFRQNWGTDLAAV